MYIKIHPMGRPLGVIYCKGYELYRICLLITMLKTRWKKWKTRLLNVENSVESVENVKKITCTPFFTTLQEALIQLFVKMNKEQAFACPLLQYVINYYFLKNETISVKTSSSFAEKLVGAATSTGAATGLSAVSDLIGAPGPSSPKRVAITVIIISSSSSSS